MLLWAAVRGQEAVELAARRDVQLGEHLVQVIFDGARADEELRPDLGVRMAISGKLRDLRFLPGELAAWFRRAFWRA
jgi:hypothetical protein